jgi:hypothetical protein
MGSLYCLNAAQRTIKISTSHSNAVTIFHKFPTNELKATLKIKP